MDEENAKRYGRVTPFAPTKHVMMTNWNENMTAMIWDEKPRQYLLIANTPKSRGLRA